MGTPEHEMYDVVGIGFGPSNLSLAVALDEHPGNVGGRPISSAFFERQPSFGWHRNMLLPDATMQISFLKDLATFRNPSSRFSFVSYLHDAGRLVQFVNNQDFFPTRQEFHQYLEWAAASLSDRVSYNSDVRAIRLPPGTSPGSADYIQVEVADRGGGGERLVNARNVVISTGLVPRMPAGIEVDDRVWHTSEFLDRYGRINPDDIKGVAVIGAGQSAAEITRFLHDNVPHAQIYAIMPSYGYAVADDTPFANQVFDPGAVDEYYNGTDQTREAFWRYHKNTNYSVVDDDVIRDLFRRTYGERVRNSQRLNFLNLTRVAAVKRAGTETRVKVQSLIDNDPQELSVDVVVFATGYDAMEPTALLGDLDQYCLRDSSGRLRVERDYRVVTSGLPCGIYLQGGTEHTHGLSASLLSNIAIRGGEIADSLLRRRAA
ncbi:MAG TPA: SidA/IucD/PvdA family monooxygenase [Actinophytocola sp.]|uniref:lysine N(6)-hydroxylase/L-ornithine N(5)-oxygenase family protein n=1 Tax=Actinophytocola sp. TaxID=1872138 RepID=UPI002DB6480C|nr:SidA/IucD/PvdA family monooxygenase [Actinophytocola sp.]HEU5471980.1 SidA/IucD/PvdA family monooxygenase [Actinophytocola sp.]